jgi:hypothetical protein
MSHELEGFLQYLRNAIFNVPGKVLGHIIVEIGNTHRLGDIANIVGVPDRHGVGLNWFDPFRPNGGGGSSSMCTTG